jgi:hypothetical protein
VQLANLYCSLHQVFGLFLILITLAVVVPPLVNLNETFVSFLNLVRDFNFYFHIYYIFASIYLDSLISYNIYKNKRLKADTTINIVDNMGIFLLNVFFMFNRSGVISAIKPFIKS